MCTYKYVQLVCRICRLKITPNDTHYRGLQQQKQQHQRWHTHTHILLCFSFLLHSNSLLELSKCAHLLHLILSFVTFSHSFCLVSSLPPHPHQCRHHCYCAAYISTTTSSDGCTPQEHIIAHNTKHDSKQNKTEQNKLQFRFRIYPGCILNSTCLGDADCLHLCQLSATHTVSTYPFEFVRLFDTAYSFD